MESVDIGKLITSFSGSDIIDSLKELNKAMGELVRTISNSKTVVIVLEEIKKGITELKNEFNAKDMFDTIGLVAGVASVAAAFVTVQKAVMECTTAVTLFGVTLNAIQAGLIIGAIVLAVVGLVTAITSLVSWLGKGSKEEQAMAEAMKEKAKVANEVNESYKNMQKSQQDAIDNGMAEVAYTQKLNEELQTLADKDGIVADKDKARAEFILGELNNALGTESKMIGNQIQDYELLKDKIDEQIEQKKLQILFDAREAEYREAIINQSKAKKEMTQAEMDLDNARANLEKNNNKATREAYESAMEAYQSRSDTYERTTRDISRYESAMVANLEGDSQKAMTILQADMDGYVTRKDIAQLSSEEQNRILKQQYEDAARILEEKELLRSKKKKMVSDEEINEAKKHAEDMYREYMRLGQSMVDGASDGIDSHSGTFRTTSDNIFITGPIRQIERDLEIQSPSKVFARIGKNIVDGASEGISNNRQSFISKTTGLFSSAISSVKSALGISSPSKVFAMIGENTALGYMQGIEDNADNVVDSMQNMIDETVKTAERGSYRLADINGLSDINSTITSSIQHKVNTEDDGLIDKINELAQKDTNIYCKVQLGENTIFNKIIEGIKQKSFERNEGVFSV